MKSIILCECLRTSADLITAISTVVLAVTTICIACWARKAFYSSERALYGNTVSNSRASYIDSLRKSFNELYSALSKMERDEREINNKIASVKYHLDPDEKAIKEEERNGIDRAFINDCLDKLLDAKEGDIENYRHYSVSILHYEWANYKKEIKKGSGLTKEEKKETENETIKDGRKKGGFDET